MCKSIFLYLDERYGVEVDFIALTFDGDGEKYAQLKSVLEMRSIGILVNNVGAAYDYPMYFLDVPVEVFIISNEKRLI